MIAPPRWTKSNHGNIPLPFGVAYSIEGKIGARSILTAGTRRLSEQIEKTAIKFLASPSALQLYERSIVVNLLVASLMILAAFSTVIGQANDKPTQNNANQELKRLENEWLNSYLRGDKQTFDRIVADDFTRTDESGKFATKVEEKALVQAPSASVNASLTNEDMQVRLYGNAAIVTGRIVSRVQDSLSFQSRFTDTLVKRDGRWQVVARHYSRIPTELTAISLDPKIYDAYVGQYEIAPKVAIDITKEGGRLMSQTAGQPGMELLPESEIEFFIKGFTAHFIFVRDETGRVTKLIINQEGQRVTASKIK